MCVALILFWLADVVFLLFSYGFSMFFNCLLGSLKVYIVFFVIVLSGKLNIVLFFCRFHSFPVVG